MGWIKKISRQMQEPILIWAIQNPIFFKRLSYLLNSVLLITFVLWIFQYKLDGWFNLDAEAAFAGISLLAVFLNQFNRKLYEKSDYSPADVLALGYVNNFLRPAIVQLKVIEANPIIYIYKPKNITELLEDGIDNFKADLRKKYLSLDPIVLELKRARARDILLIKKDSTSQVYIDFPSTLLSLLDYIDYKIASKNNTSLNDVKTELGEKLVKEFYAKVSELIKTNRIDKNIKFCNSSFKLFRN